MSKRIVVAAAVVVTTGLPGCSYLSSLVPQTTNKNADYRSQPAKVPSLDIPPDLTSPVVDDRYVIPDRGATTYSAYTRERGVAPVAGANPAVLPKLDNAHIERNGSQRWLVVTGTPDKVWPVVKDFWKDTGFQIARETPEAGILETDWAENRSKIPQDIVRNTIGRLLDGLYSSGERDKFRTRLENGANGTTEIYISHRGLREELTPDKTSTVWNTRATDPDLELEMLSRLMVKIAGADKAAPTAVAGTAGAAAPSRASYDAAKGGTLTVAEPFDRAWRRVGLALDRIGFTVEDRDRSKGTFFVRYIDPDADKERIANKTWVDKLFFWRSDPPPAKPQYRILVADANGSASVVVQDSEGKPDNSATAKRMLGLLYEQLK
jgi:outer membrane protein assembly factor BamC